MDGKIMKINEKSIRALGIILFLILFQRCYTGLERLNIAVIFPVYHDNYINNYSEEIKIKDYGFVTIQFRDSVIKGDYGFEDPADSGWIFKLAIDDHIVVNSTFSDRDWTIPVRAGKHKISYYFARQKWRPFIGTKFYTSRKENESAFSKELRHLEVEIKPNSNLVFGFKKTGKSYIHLHSLQYLLPWMWVVDLFLWIPGLVPVFTYEEVEFVVLSEGKNENQ